MADSNHHDKPSKAFHVAYNDDFKAVIGPEPKLELLLHVDAYPFAHEAGVFLSATDELFITSNHFPDSAGGRKVQISKIHLGRNDSKATTQEEVACELIHMANGGVNYQDGVLFCAQGSDSRPSGLFKMSTEAPYSVEPVITSFLGRPFNSVNDVVVHSDGSIWFTDPSYGYAQAFRPRPSLPNQVYRYDPVSRGIRVVADGFGMPNGICFSPDEKEVYITDTDQVQGRSVDYRRPATIYVFDLVYRHGQPFLTNRRLFAMTDTGIPDGIKCDTMGNVYSGCGDGVHVWSPGGVLLGKILVEGGAANFCFGREGELFVLNEHNLWRVQLDRNLRGALLGL